MNTQNVEKCESCQGADMTFEKVSTEPESDEEGYWRTRLTFDLIFSYFYMWLDDIWWYFLACLLLLVLLLYWLRENRDSLYLWCLAESFSI